MLVYSLIMFPIAILFIILSIAIYRGNTDLIHSYHQTKVTDKAAYGKAFGKALFTVALAPLLSGIIALMGDSDAVALTAVGVLIVMLFVSIGCILAVQKKYNNGLF